MNLSYSNSRLYFGNSTMLRKLTAALITLPLCALSSAQTIAYSTNFDSLATGIINGKDSWVTDVRDGSLFEVTSTLSRSGTKSCRYTGTATATPGNQYAFRSFFDSFRSETYVATVYVRVSALSIGQAWVGMTGYGTNSQSNFYVGGAQLGINKGEGNSADGFLFSPAQVTRQDIAPYDEWTRLQVIVRGYNGSTSNSGFTAANINGYVVGAPSPGVSSDYKQIDDFDLWVYNPSGTAVTAYFDDLKVERYPQGQTWVGGRALAGGWLAGKPTTVKIIARNSNGTTIDTATATTDADGYFKTQMFTTSGQCNFYVKTATSLTKKVSSLTIDPAVSFYQLDFANGLLSGDCDDNDVINTDDYLILSAAFDLSQGDAGYDARADLDGNSFVNTDDYLLLNENFDEVGEAYPL
jgi:hypothetical protein